MFRKTLLGLAGAALVTVALAPTSASAHYYGYRSYYKPYYGYSYTYKPYRPYYGHRYYRSYRYY